MANDEPDRAQYGYDHVAKCVAMQAVQTLLITDELFRSAFLQLLFRMHEVSCVYFIYLLVFLSAHHPLSELSSLYI